MPHKSNTHTLHESKTCPPRTSRVSEGIFYFVFFHLLTQLLTLSHKWRASEVILNLSTLSVRPDLHPLFTLSLPQSLSKEKKERAKEYTRENFNLPPSDPHSSFIVS
jgi:hypothetical protein